MAREKKDKNQDFDLNMEQKNNLLKTESKPECSWSFVKGLFSVFSSFFSFVES